MRVDDPALKGGDTRGYSCPKCSSALYTLLLPAEERDGICRCGSCRAIVLIDAVGTSPNRDHLLDKLLYDLAKKSFKNPVSSN